MLNGGNLGALFVADNRAQVGLGYIVPQGGDVRFRAVLLEAEHNASVDGGGVDTHPHLDAVVEPDAVTGNGACKGGLGYGLWITHWVIYSKFGKGILLQNVTDCVGWV